MFKQEIRSWSVSIFYGLFILFLLHRVIFVSSGVFETSMSYILYPFLKLQSSIVASLQEKEQEAKTVTQLRAELGSLQIQNFLLQQQLAQLQAQQIFIAQTREVVDFAAQYDYDQKSVSKVLMYSCCPQQDIMFIQGGVNKGYKKDDIVVYKNALVGRIIEVFAWYCKVALVTDKRCRISGIVYPDAQGIVCGQNNGIFEFNFVPHYKQIQVGDLVLSSGQGLVYPQGFVIGVVQAISTDLVAHKINLKPYIAYKDIDYVYVLQK